MSAITACSWTTRTSQPVLTVTDEQVLATTAPTSTTEKPCSASSPADETRSEIQSTS